MRTKYLTMIAALMLSMGAGCDKAIEAMEKAEDDYISREMDRAEKNMIDDLVKQYEIVARSGSAMERCVQASLVATAYLQNKDEARYVEWKEKERSDCAEAGMPDM